MHFHLTNAHVFHAVVSYSICFFGWGLDGQAHGVARAAQTPS